VACLVLIDAAKPEPPHRDFVHRERIRLLLRGATGLSPTEQLRHFTRRIIGKAKSKIARVWKIGDELRNLLSSAEIHNAETTPTDAEPAKSPVGSMLLRALGHYQPHAYPGRIILLRTATADRQEFLHDLGWSEVAQGGVETHEIAGEHQTVFESQHVPALARKLDSCLRAALGKKECGEE
jgi:thioesterase domain-containing protein